jgi:NAD(P)-dependent dehydrogenase (short-subunit alcohol dehydrogenase family)
MGVFDSIAEGIAGAYQKAKSAIQGPTQGVVDSTGLSNVNVTGVAPETPGMTTMGGKRGGRRSKTRRAKKSKKTLRRKH